MSRKRNKNKSSKPEITKRLSEQMEREEGTGENFGQKLGIDERIALFEGESAKTDKEKEEETGKAENKEASEPNEKPEPKDKPESKHKNEPMHKSEPKEDPEKEEISIYSMDAALNEEIGEVSVSDESDENSEETAVSERPHKFYLVFAVFVILMSIIGIISTIRFIVNTASEIANQTSLKNEIALLIYPVVTVDPPAFETAKDIPESVVIESAIWKIILTGDNSNYEKLYNSYMYVPAVDVEFAANSLFGSEVAIHHQTVGSASSSFTYNSEMNSYLVPISPRFTSYSPVITKVENVGELYTVEVDYMPPMALAVEGIKLESSTTKTMTYTLSKTKNSMTIHSLKNITKLGETYEY